MTTDRIEREILIRAPIERVWDVLTGASHMPEWFGGATARVDLSAGGDMVFHWEEHGTFHAMIERVDAPHALAFRWSLVADEAPARHNSTRVEFTLASEAGATRLRVVETGFASLAGTDASRAEHVASNRQGWAGALDGLAAYAPQAEAARRD